jgi:hypothetical protein
MDQPSGKAGGYGCRRRTAWQQATSTKSPQKATCQGEAGTRTCTRVSQFLDCAQESLANLESFVQSSLFTSICVLLDRTVQELGDALAGETAKILGEGMVAVAGRRGNKQQALATPDEMDQPSGKAGSFSLRCARSCSRLSLASWSRNWETRWPVRPPKFLARVWLPSPDGVATSNKHKKEAALATPDEMDQPSGKAGSFSLRCARSCSRLSFELDLTELHSDDESPEQSAYATNVVAAWAAGASGFSLRCARSCSRLSLASCFLRAFCACCLLPRRPARSTQIDVNNEDWTKDSRLARLSCAQSRNWETRWPSSVAAVLDVSVMSESRSVRVDPTSRTGDEFRMRFEISPRTTIKTVVEEYADRREQRGLDERLKIGETLLRTR